MHSQLGTIVFDKAFTPTGESDSLEITWASFDLINQPTKLQPTGRGLVEYSIEMFFHASFCKVDDQIKSLTDSAVNYDVLPFLLGNGKLVGDFVIINISKKVEQKDDLGNLISATVTVNLKEYVSDKLQTQQNNAKNNATATGNKKGVTGSTRLKVNPCNTKIGTANAQIFSDASLCQTYHSKYMNTSDHSFAVRLVRVMDARAISIRKTCTDMMNNNASCIATYNLTAQFQQVYNAALGLSIVINANTALIESVKPLVDTREKLLQGEVSTLNSLVHAISGKSIARTNG